MVHQTEQDRIWRFYQNAGVHIGQFDVPRQYFMARQCRPGQSVLNIGVGTGLLEQLLHQRGVEVHSLDPDPEAVARLRSQLGLGDRARVGYAQDIPFESEQFDTVIMAEVIEHLEDGVLQASLKEVLRVLKRGGMLLLSTPYREDVVGRQVFCPHCLRTFHPYGHVQSFDKVRLHCLLAEAGYAPIRLKVTTFVRWTPLRPMRILKSAVRLVLARLGEPIADPHLVAWAYKPLRRP